MASPFQLGALLNVNGFNYSMQCRAALLHDGSVLAAGQTATGTVTLWQVTSPSSGTPTITALSQTFTNAGSTSTPTDIWVTTGVGTTDIWVCYVSNGGGTAAVGVAHATYDGSTFTWDNAGTGIANTAGAGSCVATICWNGANLIVVFRDNSFPLKMTWTATKKGDTSGVGWSTPSQLNTASATGSHTFPVLVHDANLGGNGAGCTACVYSLAAPNGTEQFGVRTLLDSAADPSIANWKAEVTQGVTNYNTGLGNVACCVDPANGKLFLAHSSSAGTTGTAVIPVTINAAGTPSWGTRVVADASGTNTGVALGVDVLSKLYLFYATGAIGSAGVVNYRTSTDGGTTWSAAVATNAATAGDGFPKVPCRGTSQAFSGYVPFAFQRGTSTFTAQYDNVIVAGVLITGKTLSQGVRRSAIIRPRSSRFYAPPIPLGLQVSNQIQSGISGGPPGNNTTETDVTWFDPITLSGWRVGIIPAYGGSLIAPWYEITSFMVASITETNLATSNPDGFIHLLDNKGGTYLGTENPTFTLAELAGGSLVRRWYDSGILPGSADANGFQYRVKTTIYPGDPGFLFHHIEITNPSGAGIAMGTPALDLAMIGGLTQVNQPSSSAWLAANAFYGNIGGSTTAVPIDTACANTEPDFAYVTPANGSGLVTGVMMSKKTGLLSIPGAAIAGGNLNGLGYASNASRLKIHEMATLTTFPASTTYTLNYLQALKRNLTGTIANSIAADYLNPDTASALTGGAAASPFFDYDTGAYTFAAPSGMTCTFGHTISGQVDKRWLPAYKITGYTATSLGINLGSTPLVFGVDYLAWIDIPNQIAYVKFMKTLVASGAGAGQLNNTGLMIGIPSAGAESFAYSAN